MDPYYLTYKALQVGYSPEVILAGRKLNDKMFRHVSGDVLELMRSKNIKIRDSNILIMGGRVVGHGLAREIVKVWLSTPFDGGRHQKRLDKINQFDESNKT